MQTTIPPFARGTLEGWNKITSTEGMAGYGSFYPFLHSFLFVFIFLFVFVGLFGVNTVLLF